MNIFVAKLNYDTTEGDLRDQFAEFGEVDSCKIIMDKFTGRSKGFGFVEMSDDDAARNAIQELDGMELDGRTIVVKEAEDRGNRRGGGGGGSGGRIALYATSFTGTVASADVVITDTFVSMGDKDGPERLAELDSYAVTDELMDLAQGGAKFLHCLPAHRGEEVDADVIDGPNSLVWDEAENRLHVQKAIMRWCLHK